MMRYVTSILILCIVLVLAAAPVQPQSPAAAPPNIVLIMSDDMG